MEKQEKLKEILGGYKKGVLVAFSGGVDSTYLLKAAREVLGPGKVLAVTVASQVQPAREIQEACRLAQLLGARHRVLEQKFLEQEVLAENSLQRCYYCKKDLGQLLLGEAAAQGLDGVVDGSNADDLKDYRPGAQAARELGIRSPLQEAGLGKEEIRQASRLLGLPTWSKPAMACLATRFPYGEKITAEKLKQVERVEEGLLERGFLQVRARHHGSVARLEILPGDWQRALDLAGDISLLCRQTGFIYSALDLQGYRQGSMQEASISNESSSGPDS